MGRLEKTYARLVSSGVSVLPGSWQRNLAEKGGIRTRLKNLSRSKKTGTNAASSRLAAENERALSRRLFLDPNYDFRPVSTHNKRFQELKRTYPYFGYIGVEVEDVSPFLMFSNNDDRVAQTYFWYGPNAFESLSLRIWRELARRSNHVFDVGAFTGVYSLTAAYANRGLFGSTPSSPSKRSSADWS